MQFTQSEYTLSNTKGSMTWNFQVHYSPGQKGSCTLEIQNDQSAPISIPLTLPDSGQTIPTPIPDEGNVTGATLSFSLSNNRYWLVLQSPKPTSGLVWAPQAVLGGSGPFVIATWAP